MNAHRVARQLKEAFPGIEGIEAREDSSGHDTIHLGDAAEGGTIEGLPAADYWGEFRGSGQWINPKLEKFLERHSYWIEWYDAGTLTAYYQKPGGLRSRYDR